MKKIEAIIKPFKLQDVKDALNEKLYVIGAFAVLGQV